MNLILTKSQESQDTLLALHHDGSSNCSITGGETSDFVGDLVQCYEYAGYQSMDQDKCRNQYFSDVIHRGVIMGGVMKWIEVGPGALGTLTKLILRSSPTTTVVAIEAVESSVEQLKKEMKRFLHYYGRQQPPPPPRITIIHGLAGQVMSSESVGGGGGFAWL